MKEMYSIFIKMEKSKNAEAAEDDGKGEGIKTEFITDLPNTLYRMDEAQ